MSICAHRVVAPLVADHTWVIVSSTQGLLEAGSALPPHRSTNVSPSIWTQTDAPTSPLSWKFRVNSSATRSNLGSQNPATSPVLTLVLSVGKFDIDQSSLICYHSIRQEQTHNSGSL